MLPGRQRQRAARPGSLETRCSIKPLFEPARTCMATSSALGVPTLKSVRSPFLPAVELLQVGVPDYSPVLCLSVPSFTVYWKSAECCGTYVIDVDQTCILQCPSSTQALHNRRARAATILQLARYHRGRQALMGRPRMRAGQLPQARLRRTFRYCGCRLRSNSEHCLRCTPAFPQFHERAAYLRLSYVVPHLARWQIFKLFCVFQLFCTLPLVHTWLLLFLRCSRAVKSLTLAAPTLLACFLSTECCSLDLCSRSYNQA